MALGKLPVPGRPTIWMMVGQGPTALAVGAGGGCSDIFTLLYPFSPLSAWYRLKYCLKGPLNPNQPTNQPQKLTQLSSRSHPRHLVGKRTAQKDITIDTTSDSQVNNNFPNRWSPGSLTFNNYFYLFLYLYITWITTNNNAPQLKSPKNQNRRAALGRPAIKITGGLELVCGRPTLALSSALVHQTEQLQRKYHTAKQDQIIQKH